MMRESFSFFFPGYSSILFFGGKGAGGGGGERDGGSQAFKKNKYKSA